VRTKTLLAACVALLLLMIGVFEISRTVLSGSFADIETDTVRQSLQRVANALDADLRQIGVVASDYAHWDDTYNYVLTRNPAYVKANIFASSMATINVDVYWMPASAGMTLGEGRLSSIRIQKIRDGDPVHHRLVALQ